MATKAHMPRLTEIIKIPDKAASLDKWPRDVARAQRRAYRATAPLPLDARNFVARVWVVHARDPLGARIVREHVDLDHHQFVPLADGPLTRRRRLRGRMGSPSASAPPPPPAGAPIVPPTSSSSLLAAATYSEHEYTKSVAQLAAASATSSLAAASAAPLSAGEPPARR